VRDVRGTTAIEYALIASVISILIVTAAQTIGLTVRTFFMNVIVPAL
jgi:Flp pilus assembly pilin Flp